jgi:hypothetical protein
LNVRTQWGLTVQGGMSTGQNVADNCDVRAGLPELNVGIVVPGGPWLLPNTVLTGRLIRISAEVSF